MFLFCLLVTSRYLWAKFSRQSVGLGDRKEPRGTTPHLFLSEGRCSESPSILDDLTRIFSSSSWQLKEGLEPVPSTSCAEEPAPRAARASSLPALRLPKGTLPPAGAAEREPGLPSTPWGGNTQICRCQRIQHGYAGRRGPGGTCAWGLQSQDWGRGAPFQELASLQG